VLKLLNCGYLWETAFENPSLSVSFLIMVARRPREEAFISALLALTSVTRAQSRTASMNRIVNTGYFYSMVAAYRNEAF
jgi:hypothetical protein